MKTPCIQSQRQAEYIREQSLYRLPLKEIDKLRKISSHISKAKYYHIFIYSQQVEHTFHTKIYANTCMFLCMCAYIMYIDINIWVAEIYIYI